MRTALKLILEPIRSSLSQEEYSKIRDADRLYQERGKEKFSYIGTEEKEDFSLNMIKLLLKMHLNTDSICAILLLPLLQDKILTIEEIEEQFGKKVAFLNENLLALPTFSFPELIKNEEHKHHQFLIKDQAESFSRMLLSMTRDMRVVMLKFSERLQSLRMLEFFPIEEQLVIAYECRQIYAPLANRLGISWVKNEMEDLTLRYLFPKPFYSLVKDLSSKQEERDDYIAEVSEILENLLEDLGIEARVSGRSKHINSIYRKMINRGLSYDELYDVTAFRLICNTKDQCYQLLGSVHDKWKPISERFKDYIALPKTNMYQSLHTTVLGPHNKRMEIQIRTKKMHEFAEEGIAAHWLYKENKNPQQHAIEQFRWLRNLLRFKDEKDDEQVFMASVRDYLEEGEVFVFTPKKHVKELPKGATPIDFAYAIHTDVGHRCIGAKVNHKIVPLRYELQNGDLIEILTSNSSEPKKDWLKFTKTHRAASKIRAFFRIEQRQEAITLGRELLEKELPSTHRSITKLHKNGMFASVFKKWSFATLDEMFMQIGYEKLDPKVVVELMFPTEKEEVIEEEQIITTPTKERKAIKGVLVGGLDDILVQMAGCCNPIPGDAIIGFVSRGRGVIVHRKSCPKIQESEVERRIDVQWASGHDITHTVFIRVHGENRAGFLSHLSRVFADLKIDITSAHCETDRDEATNIFTCRVSDLKQLQLLIKGLEGVKGVFSVGRIRK